MRYEREAWAQGHRRVCGIDEVGRGPLAGPVVAAAVILPVDFEHSKLTDSKKLAARQRESIYEELVSNGSVEWGVAFVDVQEIDRINILNASLSAMVLAVESLKIVPNLALVDGSGKKRPLLIIQTGFDGTAEELYYSNAVFALRRGYNVLTGAGNAGGSRSSAATFFLGRRLWPQRRGSCAKSCRRCEVSAAWSCAFARSAQISSCSPAAARKVSAAANSTR